MVQSKHEISKSEILSDLKIRRTRDSPKSLDELGIRGDTKLRGGGKNGRSFTVIYRQITSPRLLRRMRY